MNGTVLLAFLVLALAGMALSVQGPINAALARGTGDIILAACISFLIGFLVLAVASLARGLWPDGAALAGVPWWGWIGGFFGAGYVLALTWSVPKVGVLTTAAAIVLGQLVAALVLDRIGAFGLPVNAISWQRVTGVVLVLAGLVLSRF